MAEMVYVTELDTGLRVAFPLTPESVKCKAVTQFVSHNIIGVGEVKHPRGEKLVKFSWSGRLPGASMRHMRMVNTNGYRSPAELQGIWSMWRRYGKKLRLLVTGTTINHDVYLENYTVDNEKLDSVKYSISFIVAKDILVYTTTELNIENTTQKDTSATTLERAASEESIQSAAQQTYTVVTGDCLWAIARKYYGDGSRYGEIYEANKALIDGRNAGTGLDKYTIYPGQVLSIPQ